MIINSSSRNSSNNRGESFLFVPTTGSGLMDCLLLEEVCSRLVAVGSLAGPMDNLLLFLLVAERLVSFVIGSGGDGNKCIDALGGP